MKLISVGLYTRFSQPQKKLNITLTFLAFLNSLVLGALSAYISEERYLLIFPILLLLFALLSNYRYDLLLWLCLLIFLLAQFRLAVFDLSRWIILFLLGLMSIYIIKQEKFSINPIAFGLGAVGVYSAATSIHSYYPAISLMKSVSLLLFSLFIIFVPSAIRRLHPLIGARRYFLKMYLWLAILAVITNVLFYLMMPSSSFLGGRFRGWFANPNGLAAIYGIFFVPVLAYALIKSRNSTVRLGIFLVFSLAMVELFATQSRAGITCGIISLLILSLGKVKLPSRVLILIMISLSVVIIYLENPQDNFLRRFVYRNEVVFTGSDRFPVWSSTWKNFLANPIFGSGLGVANTETDSQDLVFRSSDFTIEKANSFLGVLEELGLIGAGLLIMTLLPLLKKSFREIQSAPFNNYPITLVFASMVFSGLFNSIFEAWLLSVGSFLCFSYWIFAALIAGPESEQVQLKTSHPNIMLGIL
jgi:O-antigen ligase